MVFFHHYFYPPFYLGDIRFSLGRKAVVIFFVISGFVIAYVTERKEATPREYCVNRAARLYSVVLPGLALTLLLDYAVLFLEPSLFDPIVHSWPGLRLLASVLFLNQSWNFTIAALSNGPFWSLCYEFWYYVIFGLFIYAPKRFRYLLVAIAVLLAGPRILLLFPIWLLGVAAYHLQSRIQSARLETAVFCASSAAFLVLLFGKLALLNDAVNFVSTRLSDGYFVISPNLRVFIGGDANFPADYALGIAFALTVMTSRVGRWEIQLPRSAQASIRFCASYTFSLYLFHAPLLLFFAACSAQLRSEPARGVILTVATFGAVWAIGAFTEQRKHLYKLFFSRVAVPRSMKLRAAIDS
jgi:peptidoglycan/LPS O-acetylase OafA/YrhL